jgi:hypothetical protein
MDRFDELLLKARAEMMGQTPTRNEISKQDAFDMAWDITKRRTRMGMGFAQRAKDAEAKRQAKEAKRQERANRPSLRERFGNAYRSVRPQQSTPTEDPNFVDFMGQQGGLEQPQATRASGSPPTFTDFMGQQGGLETPQALEPEEVPMREDINTEQPPAPEPAPARAPGPTGPPPAKATAARGAPPSFPGQSPSVRAKVGGAPSRQRLMDAFTNLGMDSTEAQLRVNSPQRGEVGRQRAEQTRPLDSADIPAMPQQEPLSAKTQGQLGSREDAEANQRYQDVSDKRMQYAEAMERFVDRGDFDEAEAFRLYEQLENEGSIPQFPTLQETPTPSLGEANRTLGGEGLNPTPKRQAVNTPIPERQMAEPATTPVEPRNLPMRQPKGGVPAVRGQAPATEPLPPSQLPMRRPAGALPERTGATRPQGGSRKAKRSPITMRRDRPQINEINLPARTRRNMKNKRNKEADKVEAERTPAPQTDLPEAGETRGALDENETAMGRAMLEAIRDSGFGQPQENTEPVKKPEPQVQEQTTKKPPTAKQTTLFGGEEQTESVKPKDTVEAAQERKAKRKAKQPQVEAQTQALKPIRNMSSEEVGELILDAQEGKAEAISHLKNYSDEIERVHPQFNDEMTDLFGDTFKSNDDFSLLPSGMRQQLLKENDANVNYSLLPNGWV